MKLNRIFFLLIALLVAAAAAQAEPPASADTAKALTVRTFTFKYKDADKATAVVKPLLSTEGTISIQPGTKSVVITDAGVEGQGISLLPWRFGRVRLAAPFGRSARYAITGPAG